VRWPCERVDRTPNLTLVLGALCVPLLPVSCPFDSLDMAYWSDGMFECCRECGPSRLRTYKPTASSVWTRPAPFKRMGGNILSGRVFETALEQNIHWTNRSHPEPLASNSCCCVPRWAEGTRHAQVQPSQFMCELHLIC
jgi:hypothetical protein